MGKRGPKPSPAVQLERRASRRAAQRRREEAEAAGVVARRVVREIPSPPARPLPDDDAGWRALMAALPGYDPWAQGEGYAFRADFARRAIEWIESRCRHVKGARAGQLLRLMGWQRAIVGNLFGWVDAASGLRRYRRAFVYVPRKNAKSTLAAAIALYVLFEDGEPGAELYACAAKRDQAGILWRVARSMIAREPLLDVRCQRYQASILLDDEESFFQPLASEGKSEHGRSTHLAVIDELHAQASPDLMEAIGTSMGGRSQPILLLLTTADSVGESVCNDELARARLVRGNGGVRDRPGYDPTYLPVIYEASVDEDWSDEALWRRVNPLWDDAPTIRETLRIEARKAKDQPSYVNAFRRWYLNVQTEVTTAWLRMDHWDACALEPEVAEGDEVVLGVDLSSTTDMTAVVVLCPRTLSVLPYYWVPEETAAVRERVNEPWYSRWAAAGHLTLTPGNAIDYERVLAQVDDLARRYRVVKIGMDPALAMQPALELQRRGHVVEFVRQGWVSMGEPCNALERLLAQGLLRHGGHPVLRWNAANVRVKVGEHGSKTPVKPRDAAKIDGIVALLMALRLATIEAKPARAEPRIRSLT